MRHDAMKGIEKYPRDVLDPARKTGLILCGMGGPDGPSAVEPFLRNLFRDPAIFPVPKLLAPLIGAMIARKRSGAVAERYQLIDPSGATPQLQFTRDQSSALAGRLEAGLQQAGSADHPRIVPATAMRYWHPFPDQTVAALLEQGAEQFLVVPTYPQYSPATGGSTLDFVMTSVRKLAGPVPVHTVPDWHLLEGYLENLNRPVSEQLVRWADQGIDPGSCAMIYVAHSMPQTFIDKGDPYQRLTEATVTEVHSRVRRTLTDAGHQEWLAGLLSDSDLPLAYQSKVGPIKWLGPGVEPETLRLAAAGCKNLLVQPVSFVCEHIETLVELDIELLEEARKAGITELSRGPALNLQPEWLDSLAIEILNQAFAVEVTHHA